MGSGALPDLMLDLGSSEIILGEFFPNSSPCGALSKSLSQPYGAKLN